MTLSKDLKNLSDKDYQKWLDETITDEYVRHSIQTFVTDYGLLKPITKAFSEKAALDATNLSEYNGLVSIDEKLKPVIISISDTPLSDDKKNTLLSLYKDVLFLNFYDLSYENLYSLSNKQYDEVEGYLFTTEQAKQIIDFATKYKDDSIFVHCTAGISRSQAVALFISKYIYNDLNLFNELYHDDSKQEGGNQLVYKTLTTEMYIQNNPDVVNDEWSFDF